MAKKRHTDIQPAQAEVVEPVPRAWEEKPELRGNDRSYPEEIRERFRELALGSEMPGPQIARELGISRTTAQEWLFELKQEMEPYQELESMRMAEKLAVAGNQFLRALIARKWEKASVRDMAIAAGIMIERRRDLLGPQKGGNISRLRIAWKDGSGAVEVETGGG